MPKLSIVIPCYNERDTVASLIDAVQAAPIEIEQEIIIVDDCSDDGTGKVLDEEIAPRVAKVLHHKVKERLCAPVSARPREILLSFRMLIVSMTRRTILGCSNPS